MAMDAVMHSMLCCCLIIFIVALMLASINFKLRFDQKENTSMKNNLSKINETFYFWFSFWFDCLHMCCSVVCIVNIVDHMVCVIKIKPYDIWIQLVQSVRESVTCPETRITHIYMIRCIFEIILIIIIIVIIVSFAPHKIADFIGRTFQKIQNNTSKLGNSLYLSN